MLTNSILKLLYGETFTTSTSTARIWIAEIKSLAVQSIGEIQCGIYEIKKAFKIGNDLYAVVLEHLVSRLLLVVKIKFVTKPRTTTPNNTYPHKVSGIICNTGISHQLLYFGFCLIAYVNTIF